MTLKSIVIVVALVGGLCSLFLKVVKALSAKNPTPENLKDVYDAETYEKWKKYMGEHSRLDIVSTVISCVITVALLYTNAYAAFASLFPESNWFLQMLAVILLEGVVDFILGTVTGYIATMKIEEKYGFNRSSLGTFVMDRIRSLIAGTALALALAMLIAVFHNAFGVFMIPVFALAGFGISMLASFLYPILSRLGNKFTPLEDGELKDSLMELLNKYGYKVKAIEVMDASRRTTKLNAYFTGFGKLKTIVLYDNLINAMTPEEICAVFAHELGHGLHKDVQKSQVLSAFRFLLIGAIAWAIAETPAFYVEFGFMESLSLSSYLPPLNYGFTYILLGVGLSVLQPIIGFVMNARSRRAEYRADRQAVIEGYGEAMISAFKKMARDNFAHLSPSFINVILEYSHPALNRRIKNVEREMRRLGKRR